MDQPLLPEPAWDDAGGDDSVGRRQDGDVLGAPGVIRRFGAAIRHHKTGFTANAMGVWDCPPARVEEVGQTMASFTEVSHCYERPRKPQWPANLYTMIHARSREDVEQIGERIAEATGLRSPRLLYSTREFKKSSMKYFTDTVA